MNMSSYIILWILLCGGLHHHWCVRCLNHLFMKHNPSLLLFLFIHRLEEIPQFHLLLFSVILSKMKINPLFYVRCVLMRVCVSWSFWSRRVWDYVIQWITSLDYVTFLSIILNIKFSLLSICFRISIVFVLWNAMSIALFILAQDLPSSCLKGFEILILAIDM